MQLLLITKKSDQKPDQVKSELLNTVTEPLRKWGYKLEQENNSSLLFVRKYFPWWTILIAILLFPLGLLALVFGRRALFITFTANETETGSDVVIQGEADENIIKALDEMKF